MKEKKFDYRDYISKNKFTIDKVTKTSNFENSVFENTQPVRTIINESVNERKLKEDVQPLYKVAQTIKKDWKNMSPHAKPYVDAMSSLDSVKDKYYMDSGKSIVAYFLSNAGSWKGDVAKDVKLYLKSLIK